jgi:beta-lactamase superfamily II metal-dependent hydrolase
MRGDNKLTVFASGNGDSIMIEAYRKTVLTDVHYRQAGAEDEENDDIPDFAPDILSACPNHHLDVFVLTHPDKDHLGGADAIFHFGPPHNWNPDPDDGEPKIIIDEIWCSPYAVNPHYVTDHAKPLIDEIKRRNGLRGTASGTENGNRLVVMDTSTHQTGSVVSGLEWRLLAPTRAEWNIPKAAEDETPTSSNPTSLVIRWTVTVGGGKNLILLGGDATVDVMERIEQEVHACDADNLAWHVLVALHHCSRRSLGRVMNDGETDEEFEESERALKALGEQRGDGFVVSSSKQIVRGAQTPPSFHAKNRYLRILARGANVTDAERKRFLCTGGDTDNDTPTPVIFNLTAGGPTLSQKPKASAIIGPAGSSSVGRGGGDG